MAETESFKLQLPTDLRERLQQEADEAGHSVAEEIRNRIQFSFTVNYRALEAGEALQTLLRVLLNSTGRS
jgi:hypothetical protein